MKIKLNNVRLAFPVLWEAKNFNGEGKPAFGAALLIERSDKQNAAITAAIDAVAKEKWGAKAEQQLKLLRATGKSCLHNGDLKSSYAGFGGMNFISSRNAARPTVLDSDKTPLTESDGRIYAGCYVNVVLDLWAQDNNYGKRVNATLMGVQFFREGDAFSGGGSASDDDFDDVTSGTEAEDFV